MTPLYRFSRFRAADWISLTYIFIWIILVLIYYHQIPYAFSFLCLYLSGFSVSFFLAGLDPVTSVLKFVRRWHYFFYLPLFFTALHYLIPAIHPANIDQALVQIDRQIFLTDPTVWFEKLYHPGLSDLLQLSYSSFYFLPLILLIPLYFKGKLVYFERMSFVVLLAFYSSYFLYLIFPALGPRFFLAHLQTQPIPGNFIYLVLSSALNGLENIQWDAFPSGHVAVALLPLYYSYFYSKKIFFLLLPLVSLLVISTLYLRYHYFIDIFFGGILFLFCILIDRQISRQTD